MPRHRHRHRHRKLTTAILAAVGSVVLLGGCAHDTSPDDPAPAPASPTESAIPSPAAGADDGAPLGLTVRYVDENGRFATLEPRDFPR